MKNYHGKMYLTLVGILPSLVVIGETQDQVVIDSNPKTKF